MGLSEDLESFRRSINLNIEACHFDGTSATRSLVSTVLKSDFIPRNWISADHPAWKSFTDRCTSLDNRTSRNLDPAILRAWKELISNPLAYLTKADKGGKAVLWPKDGYRTEGLRQLLVTTNYRELDAGAKDELLAGIVEAKTRIIHQLRRDGCITPAEVKRLINEEWRVPPIYFLPKIHKEKRPDTGTFAGRPIIGASGNVIKSLDLYITKLTATLLRLIPGSLSDTTDMLNGLSRLPPLPLNTTLFSADVDALYPSIPWEEGFASATWFYATHHHVVSAWCKENGFLPPPGPRMFRTILQLVISSNVFHFQESRWFHQISGTAMGCSISVFFANTFMFRRMRDMILEPDPRLLYLGRYIDDIIGVFTGPKEEIPPLFSGTVDAAIGLSWVFSDTHVDALDVRIGIGVDRTITTTLYKKPTDGHQFVHWSSAHPLHLKKSLPYSQLLRIKRICSDEGDFRREAASLLDRFRHRGYPRDILVRALAQAWQVPRDQLLRKSERAPLGALCFITKFDPATADELRRAVREMYAEIQRDPIITERARYQDRPPLPVAPPITAFRVGRTLGSSLGPLFKKGEKASSADVPVHVPTGTD